MIIVRFRDEATQERALELLIGRFSGHSWAGGEAAVPEEALVAMAREGIPFTVEGPATHERILSLRDSLAAGVGRQSAGSARTPGRDGNRSHGRSELRPKFCLTGHYHSASLPTPKPTPTTPQIAESGALHEHILAKADMQASSHEQTQIGSGNAWLGAFVVRGPAPNARSRVAGRNSLARWPALMIARSCTIHATAPPQAPISSDIGRSSIPQIPKSLRSPTIGTRFIHHSQSHITSMRYLVKTACHKSASENRSRHSGRHVLAAGLFATLALLQSSSVSCWAQSSRTTGPVQYIRLHFYTEGSVSADKIRKDYTLNKKPFRIPDGAITHIRGSGSPSIEIALRDTDFGPGVDAHPEIKINAARYLFMVGQDQSRIPNVAEYQVDVTSAGTYGFLAHLPTTSPPIQRIKDKPWTDDYDTELERSDAPNYRTRTLSSKGDAFVRFVVKGDEIEEPYLVRFDKTTRVLTPKQLVLSYVPPAGKAIGGDELRELRKKRLEKEGIFISNIEWK